MLFKYSQRTSLLMVGMVYKNGRRKADLGWDHDFLSQPSQEIETGVAYATSFPQFGDRKREPAYICRNNLYPPELQYDV